MEKAAANQRIEKYAEIINASGKIDPDLYAKHDVKKGLRDINGKGVVAGLTEISEVQSFEKIKGESVPCRGKLFYRGYNIEDIVKDVEKQKIFGFEEVCYLLIMGDLPTRAEYTRFRELLSHYTSLPKNFVRDSIMNVDSKDVMNLLARCVLSLYVYDKNADDISISNVLKQSLKLIAKMPLLTVYGYHSYNHCFNSESLVIRPPKKDLSVAENILHMLKPDGKYTELEARILDVALILHAEHGGGNNSTFTNHVVTSSATDTYSAVAASLASLKGPRHGGANIKVVHMFDDIKKNVKDTKDKEKLEKYLTKILHKEAFDKKGLIYGMGHAVYSLSDPRAVIFKEYVRRLAEEKGLSDEFALYSDVEALASEVISKERKIYKGVSANVDFYSGFVYRMLGLPEEIFTPLFAISRMAGWSAHRIEELANEGKIIRPAYIAVSPRRKYTDFDKRK